jgi:hypothetical protein
MHGKPAPLHVDPSRALLLPGAASARPKVMNTDVMNTDVMNTDSMPHAGLGGYTFQVSKIYWIGVGLTNSRYLFYE